MCCNPWHLFIAAAAAISSSPGFAASEVGEHEAYRLYRCAVQSDLQACRPRSALSDVPRLIPGPYASKLIIDGRRTTDAIAEARGIGEEPVWQAPRGAESMELSALERYERWMGRWTPPRRGAGAERTASN